MIFSVLDTVFIELKASVMLPPGFLRKIGNPFQMKAAHVINMDFPYSRLRGIHSSRKFIYYISTNAS